MSALRAWAFAIAATLPMGSCVFLFAHEIIRSNEVRAADCRARGGELITIDSSLFGPPAKLCIKAGTVLKP